MRKKLLSIGTLCSLCVLTFAGTEMCVEKNDGTIIRYNIDDVNRVFYNETSAVGILDAAGSNYQFFVKNDSEVEVVGLINGTSEMIVPDKVRIDDKVYSVTSIGPSAFSSSTFGYMISSIELPSTIKSVGYNAFASLVGLTEFKVASDNSYFATIDGVLYNKDKTELVCVPGGITKYSIPSGVTTIGLGAFKGCTLSDLTISSTVEEIPAGTFQNNLWISNVTISSGLKNIGEKAFYKSGLKTINIPSSVETIGSEAFASCNSLKEISSLGAKNIGEKAFYYCKSLESINITSTVETIGSEAFEYCDNLKEIGDLSGTKDIGAKAFTSLFGLKSLEGELTIGAANIGESAFYGCSSLSGLTLKEGVKTIGDNAFDGCENIKGELTIGATNIGKSAFRDCSSLSGLTLIEGVKTIGDYAFRGCSSLSGLTLKEGVKTIGDYAFYGCENIKGELTIGATNIGESAFRGCSSLSGLTLIEGVKTIGEYAFNDCSNLSSVISNKDLETIGEYAFYDCSNLSNFNFYEGLKSIGSHAFSYCNLTNVTIPYSVTYIGDAAFYPNENVSNFIYNYNEERIGRCPTDYVYATNMTYNANEKFTTFDCGVFGLYADTIFIPSSITKIINMQSYRNNEKVIIIDNYPNNVEFLDGDGNAEFPYKEHWMFESCSHEDIEDPEYGCIIWKPLVSE